MILQRFKLIDIHRYQMHLKETLTIKPDGFKIKVRPRADRERGEFSGGTAVAAAAAKAPRAPVTRPSHNTPMLVLYGSNLGSAEELATRMEDYVLDFIPDCIRRVQQDSGEQDVNVIGYCFGGVLSLLYGSIFNDGPMKNLICFTTPIDFREMKLFSNFSDRRYFDVDRLVDSVGNLPPEMILSSFEMLRPARKSSSAS